MKARANWREMVKLHEQCDAPGEVIGVTIKCRGGGGGRSDKEHQTRGLDRWLIVVVSLQTEHNTMPQQHISCEVLRLRRINDYDLLTYKLLGVRTHFSK